MKNTICCIALVIWQIPPPIRNDSPKSMLHILVLLKIPIRKVKRTLDLINVFMWGRGRFKIKQCYQVQKSQAVLKRPNSKEWKKNKLTNIYKVNLINFAEILPKQAFEKILISKTLKKRQNLIIIITISGKKFQKGQMATLIKMPNGNPKFKSNVRISIRCESRYLVKA